MFTGHNQEINGAGVSGPTSNNDSTEIFYSVSFTEEDYRNFSQQQDFVKELKELQGFPSYLVHLVDLVRRHGSGGGDAAEAGQQSKSADRFFAVLKTQQASNVSQVRNIQLLLPCKP